MTDAQDTLPGMERVFSCPIVGCTWSYTESGATVTAEDWDAAQKTVASRGENWDQLSSEQAMGAAVEAAGLRAAGAIEAVFESHNGTHTYVEALMTIAQLQSMLSSRDNEVNALRDALATYEDAKAPEIPGYDHLGSTGVQLAGRRLPEHMLSPELKTMRDEIRRERGL